MKHSTIEKLCGFLSIPSHKDYAISLRLQAFDQEHNNSRYIFWTQFSLRGIIADWIYRYVAGSGTQLQHFLGYITSNKHYERLFDNFQLIKLIPLEQRTSPYVLQGKHLIAQGLIGYLLRVSMLRQAQHDKKGSA